MPASVYKLVFKDPSMKKLIPNKLQIGTYTNDTVKIVGTCKLYLVHPDTKKLIETIFYVATNDHPKKTKQVPVTVKIHRWQVPKWKRGPPYTIHLDPNV